MIFEDLANTANTMIELQKKKAAKESVDKQENIDAVYRATLIKANSLVNILEYLYSETDIPKDDGLIASLISLMNDLEDVLETGVASPDGVYLASKTCKEIISGIEKSWDYKYDELAGPTVSTLNIIKSINPNGVTSCINNISAARDWSLDEEHFKKMKKGLDDADKLLAGLGLDEDILGFLRNVNAGTATLADINEKVLSWIRKEKLEERIRIKFSTMI